MRGAVPVLSTALEVSGFGLVVVAACLLSLPLALFVTGVGLIVGAQTIGRGR